MVIAGINIPTGVRDSDVISQVLINNRMLNVTAGNTRIIMFNKYRRYSLNQDGQEVVKRKDSRVYQSQEYNR